MKPVPRIHRHWKKESLQLYRIPTILHKSCGHSVTWIWASLCIFDRKTLTALEIMVRIRSWSGRYVQCLYSLNDDDSEGVGQLQGQKLRRACHALSVCPSPWGGGVRDLPLLSSSEPVGRVLPVLAERLVLDVSRLWLCCEATLCHCPGRCLTQLESGRAWDKTQGFLFYLSLEAICCAIELPQTSCSF